MQMQHFDLVTDDASVRHLSPVPGLLLIFGPCLATFCTFHVKIFEASEGSVLVLSAQYSNI